MSVGRHLPATLPAILADADADVAAAVDGALAALLADKDVAEVTAVEGGLIEVLRRGRRERLQALLEGPLFELLRERGADQRRYAARLPGGARLIAAPLVDGRVALAIAKAPPTDVRLEHLVEEGLLPPGIDAELVAAVREGGGVGVVGPARAAKVRVAVALARALSTSLRVVSLSADAPAGCLPSPAGDIQDSTGGGIEGGVEGGIEGSIEARAWLAVQLGADVMLALDVSAADAAVLGRAVLPVPVVAVVRCASMAALQLALGDVPVRAVFALCAVIGLGPDGRPRLVEVHGSVGDAPALAPTTPTHAATPAPLHAARPASMTPASMAPATTAASTQPVTVDMLPSLGDAPPADWASSDADDDPGWELGTLSASGDAVTSSSSASSTRRGSFDAALEKSATKRAPFQPRPPQPHPQARALDNRSGAARALTGTGGLTFEPPAARGDAGDDAGTADADAAVDDADDDGRP